MDNTPKGADATPQPSGAKGGNPQSPNGPGGGAGPAGNKGPGGGAGPGGNKGPGGGAGPGPGGNKGPGGGGGPGPGGNKGPGPGPAGNKGGGGGPGPGGNKGPGGGGGPGPGPNKGPGGGPKPGSGGPGGPAKPSAPPVVEVKPLAQRAHMKRRHLGVLFSFLLMVLLPLVAFGYYLWEIAEDQYSSTTAFSVRSEEGGSASDLLGGLVSFAGSGGTGVDSDILYEFIQSQEMVEAIDAELDLRAHYGAHWETDPLFSIWPDATLEDLVWFWQRVLRISYDQSTGLMEVRVLAFDPQMAQTVAQAIIAKSQDMINALSEQAREDAMRYALEDLGEAQAQLREAREALTEFRTRTQIVDPETDIQTRLGVMNNLQQALADALIEYDLLSDTAASNDPRVVNAQRRIDVIQERIQAERTAFASQNAPTLDVSENYPTLIAEFESLSVDREFAEQTYRTALTAVDLARDNATRQSRYLATYIRPTLAQSAGFPRRIILLGLATLFLTMTWSILALIYYSIRDRG